MKRLWIIFACFLVLAVAAWDVGRSARVHQWWYDLTKPSLPAAQNINQGADPITNSAVNDSTNVNAQPTPVPAELNLDVPFTTQAPQGVWDADHEEFCEEATVIMAGRFFQGKGFATTADAEAALQQVKQWELTNLGFYFDTTAAETASIIRGVYGLAVTLKVNPTVDDIKRALADGHLVIVPAEGRQLKNPNFKAPGPVYHNLVIRGYTKSGQFITNDPGTRVGKAYVYNESVIMNAMHDWVPSGIRTKAALGDATGPHVILIVSRS